MNSNIDRNTLSSMTTFSSTFDSVASIVNYLREPSPPEVVVSSTTSSTAGSTQLNNTLKSTKGRKKEKEQAKVMNTMQINAGEIVEVLPSGRVKYGPITVNPRKQPSKTLFTGRRSKYEKLSHDEEEKRRMRRERNRLAATKCREKRETVLAGLQAQCDRESKIYENLLEKIRQLQEQKQRLESMLSNRIEPCQLQQINHMTTLQQPSSMIFNDTHCHPSLIQKQVPPVLPHQVQMVQNIEGEISQFLQPAPILTNSAYSNGQSNHLCNVEQSSQQHLITMTSSSLDRLINSLETPATCTDNNNNNTCSDLFNSTYGSSSCAQQHSSSSEDDSLPPARNNAFVC
ncbi:unnamed protein product [Rotaria socialis]|uniref:BZIP domain-containing protein n=3 Tax=Rotaria TaxID=231623 RepID=A0A818W402_9BILA|nr:unnamed protein product [Rotaria socialis]